MLSDLRYALRQLANSPGFAIIAIVTLAIGIGANTAIFSALDAALLRPLPYPHADRLVEISERRLDGGRNSVAGGSFLDWSEHQQAFDALALVDRVQLNLRGDGSPKRLNGLAVSHGFLSVFGVPPILGRDFIAADEDPAGDNRVVMLTEELWQSDFGANPALIGTTIILNDVPLRIIGIARAGTWMYRDAQFFVPAVLDPKSERVRRTPHWASVYGRLKAGVTAAQGDADLNGVKQRLKSLYPAWKKDWGVSVDSLSERLAANTRPALLVLLVSVVVVLMIACANVANLLLARASERRQELALRSALGASGTRLMRQVLTESFLLAVAGGGLGVLLSFWGVDLLRHLTADFLPRAMAPVLNAHVMIYSLIVSSLTGILFGIFPAWQARRVDLNDTLKNGGRNASAGGRNRTQASLVIAEVAFTVMLLFGAGLLFRSLVKTAHVELGFDPEHALAFDLSLPDATYRTAEQRLAFTRAALDRIRAVPGVEAAGTGLAVPFSRGGYGEYLGRTDRKDDGTLSRVNYISGGYLEALGTRLLAGRYMEDSDNRIGAARVVVINQTAAQHFFPTQPAVGESISFNGNDWKVVGVIADVPDIQLDRTPLPFAYCAQAFKPQDYSVVVRTSLAPLTLRDAINRAVQSVDPGLPLANVRSLDHAMAASMTARRLILGLVVAFASTALLLACIGLYGVMAYSVTVRRRELCIRLALGADPKQVRSMVLRDGLRLVIVGLAIGTVGAFGGARLIASLLFSVSAYDPAVLTTVLAVLLVVGIVSCWLPAITASKANPLAALRAE